MRLFLLLFVLVWAACNETTLKNRDFQISLERSAVLDSLSSGSGLIFSKNTVFVVSDNMNGFFKLDTAKLVYSFIGFDSLSPHIQSKDIKEDFENATEFKYEGKDRIIAFGSGSVENTREKILMIAVDDPQLFRIYNAKPFYNALKQQLAINTSQLNIEASFTSADSIYLLNRGTNQSISIGLPDLVNAIATNFTQLPAMHHQSFSLPKIDGYNASFSGACYYKKDTFLFSATVEKTNNWVDDGEVAGSYIGVAKTNGSLISIQPLMSPNNQMLPQKIESIALAPANGVSKKLYAISDNDNGKSTWFIINITGLH